MYIYIYIYWTESTVINKTIGRGFTYTVRYIFFDIKISSMVLEDVYLDTLKVSNTKGDFEHH